MPSFDINNERTVFVLGAGASHPYGLPLSPNLKKMILSAENEILVDCLKNKGCEDKTINSFKKALRYGDHGTIDLFLEAKNSFREIGALFIASAIARAEREDTLFEKSDWYTALYRILGLDCAGTGMPPLAIVTLNYDRSLEQLLTSYLDYNCPDKYIETSKAKLADIKIVHAHGSLGDIATVPYGSVWKNAENLCAAAQSIKIVSDLMDDSPGFMEAEQLLGRAQNIVFIGFGYNRVTTGKLLKHVKLDKAQIFGTAFNLPEDTVSELKQRLGDSLHLAERKTNAVNFLKSIGLTD
jgi:hypothetical protein